MAFFKTDENVDIKVGSNTSINVLPVSGHILPFAGPSNKIPTGWVLCDGTNGTPDLRGKVPGGITNISVGANQVHSHAVSHSLGAFNVGSVVDSATVGTTGQSANGSAHSHSGYADIYAVAWGNTGPANRSNGTQANVIGMTHTHGGTISGATTFNTGNANAGHTHSAVSGPTIDGTSGNTHSHSISSAPGVVNTSSISHTALPSIFYVNFIMKV